MDALLAWYLAVFIGFGVSVRHKTREQEMKPPHVRMLPPWLATITAHVEALEGYQDPLFFPETDKQHGTTQKH